MGSELCRERCAKTRAAACSKDACLVLMLLTGSMGVGMALVQGTAVFYAWSDEPDNAQVYWNGWASGPLLYSAIVLWGGIFGPFLGLVLRNYWSARNVMRLTAGGAVLSLVLTIGIDAAGINGWDVRWVVSIPTQAFIGLFVGALSAAIPDFIVSVFPRWEHPIYLVYNEGAWLAGMGVMYLMTLMYKDNILNLFIATKMFAASVLFLFMVLTFALPEPATAQMMSGDYVAFWNRENVGRLNVCLLMVAMQQLSGFAGFSMATSAAMYVHSVNCFDTVFAGSWALSASALALIVACMRGCCAKPWLWWMLSAATMCMGWTLSIIDGDFGSEWHVIMGLSFLFLGYIVGVAWIPSVIVQTSFSDRVRPFPTALAWSMRWFMMFVVMFSYGTIVVTWRRTIMSVNACITAAITVVGVIVLCRLPFDDDGCIEQIGV